MPFQRPTLPELQTRITQDLLTRLNLAGAALRRSLSTIFGAVYAGAVHQLHGHLQYLSAQILPDVSELEYLERHASLYQLYRTEAAYATGSATATGTNGVVIPMGTVLQRSDGVEYETTGEATIASGTATLGVTARVAGDLANADAATVLTFVSPIAGVTATAAVAVGGLVGGADAGTDEALRATLLDRLRRPPQGGSADDYVRWAKEVAGVTRAWVYPEELGAGTVTVRFVRDDDGSGAAILPSAGEVTTVQDYIDVRRPVTATVTVVAPVGVALDLTLSITPDTADTRAAVLAELADLLAREAEPGGPILLSQLLLAIGVASGVTDFTLTTPAADVTHSTGEIAILGTATWT